MSSTKNEETEQTSPTQPTSNPVDSQPFTLVLSLTPLQWNVMYETLLAHYSGMGVEAQILHEVKRALVSSGLRKERS